METNRNITGSGSAGAAAQVGREGATEEKYQLNFKSHCFFCLQPQTPPTLEEVFAAAALKTNSKILTNFQPVINYLTGTDPTHDKSRLDCIQKGVHVMERMPPMCHSCFDVISKLWELHEQLLNIQRDIQLQTDLAREVVRTAAGRFDLSMSYGTQSERIKFFARMREGNRSLPKKEKDMIRVTTKIVTELHNKIMTEASGKKEVKYPSSVPKDFVPIPEIAHVVPPEQVLPIAEFDDSQFDFDSPPSMINQFQSQSLPPTSTFGGGAINSEAPEEIIVSVEIQNIKCENDSSEETEDSVVEVSDGTGDMDMGEGDTDPGTSSSDPDSDEEEDQPQPVKKKVNRRDNKELINGVPRGELQACDMCGKLVPFPEIVEHLETHHVQDYMTPCPYPNCRSVFSSVVTMEFHLTRCHKRTLRPGGYQGVVYSAHVKCEACGEDVKRLQLHFHLQEHENQLKNKRFPCPIPGCSQKYALKRSLEAHLRTHDLRKRSEQPCSECQQKFKVGDMMEEHLKVAHGAAEVIQCKHCPFLFPSWESLLDHRYEHRRTVGFSCDLCEEGPGLDFTKHELLCRHYFLVHQLGKQFICNRCDKPLFSRRGLPSHTRMHSGDPTVKKRRNKNKTTLLNCDLCPGVSFAGKLALRFHNIRLHGAQPLTCRHCPETFRSASALRKHRQGHLGPVIVRRYSCRVAGCGKVYKSITELNRHKLAKHSANPRPFLCGTCGRGFTKNYDRTRHVDRIHLGKPPKPCPRVVCEECGEDFATSGVLKKHKLIHTGERPHECPMCGQRFRTKSGLKGHEAAHRRRGRWFKPKGPVENAKRKKRRADDDKN